MQPTPTPVQVLHLAAPSGPLFALHHRPGNARPRAAIVFVHALAEEMNKSRRMVALQSRALAGAGFAVLLPDLHGCGDSAGEFGEARWAHWQQDIAMALDWLRNEHPATPLWLWGHRAGALLACQALQDDSAGLLLWQPLTNGEQALRPWRRMQRVAGLLQGATASSPAPGSDGGKDQPLHAAGYNFAPELLQALQAATFTPPADTASGRPLHTVWLDLQDPATAPPTPDVAPAVPAAAAPWQALAAAQGPAASFSHQALPGPAFWRSSEIDEVPALVEATTRALLAIYPDVPAAP